MKEIEQKIKDLGYIIKSKKEIKDLVHIYKNNQHLISQRYLQYTIVPDHKNHPTDPAQTSIIKQILRIHFKDKFKDIDVMAPFNIDIIINLYL